MALFRMFAISLISTIKVDCPVESESDAPTLVNILSVKQMLACFAGTKEPICAIRVMSATCLI